MGQTQCTDSQDPYDDQDDRIKYFRLTNSSLNQTNDEFSILSFRKSMGIGKYLKSPCNKFVDQLWTNLIAQTNTNTNTIQSTLNSYQGNSLGNSLVQQDNLISKEIRLKYRFVVNKEDEAIIKLCIMDYKGVKQLLRLGIPSQLRWSAWKCILLYKNRALTKHMLYDQMLNIVKENSDSYKEIEKDVQRTLTSHRFFIEHSGCGHHQLTRVLNSLSNYLISLGYCQGMNFLVGFLLIVSGGDECLTFSSICSLLLSQDYILYFLYDDGLPLLFLMQFIINEQLKKYFPDLKQHLIKTETSDTFWLTKFILSLYLYVFSLDTCLRLWDYIIARGTLKGLIELTLGIIEEIKQQMMNTDNLGIANLFSGSSKISIDIDVNLAIFNAQTKYRLKRKTIVKLTNLYVNKQKLQNNGIIKIILHYENKQKYQQLILDYMAKIRSNDSWRNQNRQTL